MNNAPHKSAQELREIARLQQCVLYGILVNIFVNIQIFTGPQILVSIFPGAFRDLPPVVLLSIQILYLLVALAVAVAVVRAAILLGRKVYHPIIAVIMGLLTLTPFFGLLILLHMNQRATAMLQRRGISVGLMGANMRDFEGLE